MRGLWAGLRGHVMIAGGAKHRPETTLTRLLTMKGRLSRLTLGDT